MKVASYFEESILYMPVPQTEHVPFIAGRPFFIFTFVALIILRGALHFTQ